MTPSPEKKKLNCQNAIATFERFAAEADRASDLDVAGLIKSFELAYETFWKFLQERLSQEGVEAASPRMAFKRAYSQGWISDEALWLEMINHRNLTVHTDNRDLALEIFDAAVQRYLPALRETITSIAQERPG